LFCLSVDFKVYLIYLVLWTLVFDSEGCKMEMPLTTLFQAEKKSIPNYNLDPCTDFESKSQTLIQNPGAVATLTPKSNEKKIGMIQQLNTNKLIMNRNEFNSSIQSIRQILCNKNKADSQQKLIRKTGGENQQLGNCPDESQKPSVPRNTKENILPRTPLIRCSSKTIPKLNVEVDRDSVSRNQTLTRSPVLVATPTPKLNEQTAELIQQHNTNESIIDRNKFRAMHQVFRIKSKETCEQELIKKRGKENQEVGKCTDEWQEEIMPTSRKQKVQTKIPVIMCRLKIIPGLNLHSGTGSKSRSQTLNQNLAPIATQTTKTSEKELGFNRLLKTNGSIMDRNKSRSILQVFRQKDKGVSKQKLIRKSSKDSQEMAEYTKKCRKPCVRTSSKANAPTQVPVIICSLKLCLIRRVPASNKSTNKTNDQMYRDNGRSLMDEATNVSNACAKKRTREVFFPITGI
ncbi:hypothetical protein QYM36_010985, partial [Artemia franciscana]